MKKSLIGVGLILLMSVFPTLLLAGDPTTPTYLVDRYANNAGPGTTMDTLVRLINIAMGGTPLTSPVGDVCANIYVFDSKQEMISCCSCRLTPNELVTASVANDLTNNPLISVIPAAGVIKIMPTAAGTAVCSATAPSASSDASLLAGFSTHLETSGPATFITETNIPIAALSSDEAAFLTNACIFVQYLGGGYGRGTCGCTAKTYGISGTISGAGGSGATVNLTGTSTASVIADASGNYIFTGLGSGSYTVTPNQTGFTFTPASQPTAVSSANVSGVNFVSAATYSISGTISGAGGSAATVNLTGAATATVTADASGNYAFAGLTNGSYTVTPSKSGFSFSPANQPVTLNTANATGVNFSTVTYIISGKISGAGGTAAKVTLSGAATATVTADASGKYTFAGLTNGSYTVTPSKPGFSYSPSNRSVTLNCANVTGVNFGTVTYSISGTISGSGGNSATVTLSGTSNASLTVDALGSYTFANLVNGSYTITPSNPGFIFTPPNKAVTVSGADMVAVNFTSTAQLAIDQVISTDRSSSSATITSPTFTTTSTNELLLAFISTDATSAGIAVTGVTSADGALTWSLVRRTHTQLGASEIWRAFTPATLSGASVRATLSQSVAASITVVTFTGVDTSTMNGSGAIGATGGNSANSGAPTASLTTTRNNSWVIGVGNDWDSATSRTAGPNQTMVHQFLALNGDTFWVQRQTSTTALAGTVVTINDTAPIGDSYNLSICEVLPAP